MSLALVRAPRRPVCGARFVQIPGRRSCAIWRRRRRRGDGARSAATGRAPARAQPIRASAGGCPPAVDSLRAISEGAPAVGASVSDNRDVLIVEVCHSFVDRSSLGEDLASAMFAGVGSFVGEGLDLSGDEPYSFHGRELPAGALCCTRLHQDFPPYFSPTVSGTITRRWRSTARSTSPGRLAWTV